MLGAAGTGAGLAATIMGSSSPAQAANGSPVLLGDSNTATSTTEVTTSSGTGIQGILTGSSAGGSGVSGIDESTGSGGGHGTFGRSVNGVGVYGIAESGAQVGVQGVFYEASGLSIPRAGVAGDTEGTDGEVGVFGSTAQGTAGVYGLGNGESGITPVLQSGVVGDSDAGYGVLGMSSGTDGVHGITTVNGQTGVFGDDQSSGGATGVVGRSAFGNGVKGQAGESSGYHFVGQTAVFGDTDGGIAVGGISTDQDAACFVTYANNYAGVYGEDFSADGGYGVVATTVSGTALLVDGPAEFSRSGLATVAGTSTKTAKSVVVTGVALTQYSQILATPQVYVTGAAVAAVVPNVAKKSFTIYLTKLIKVSMPIAWFIMENPVGAGPRNPAPAIQRTPR
ncbi:MAG TPA: hypothetical protein VGH27_11810 [Streptosporangiaceae bacterium]|jgi:hypothetical protein